MAKKLKIKGKDYDVDDSGFLLDRKKRDMDWEEHVRQEEAVLELTREHRLVMDKIEAYFDRWGTIPTAADLSRATGLKIRRIHELFPTGPGRGACRMVGLNPKHGLIHGRLPRSDKDRMIAKSMYKTEDINDA